MHRRIGPCRVARPTSVEEAVSIATGDHGAAYIAGGTALLPELRLRARSAPKTLVDLSRLDSIAGVKSIDDERHLGALTLVRDLAASELFVDHPKFGAVLDACAALGSWQVRNLATVGGNISSGAPHAELLAPLLALDAHLVFQDAVGQHRQRLADAWTTGSFVLSPAALVTAIVLPGPGTPASASAYAAYGSRSAMDVATVAAAVAISRSSAGIGCRIALINAAPMPLALDVEVDDATQLVGAVVNAGYERAEPFDDLLASADYRHAMVRVVLEAAATTASTRLDDNES